MFSLLCFFVFFLRQALFNGKIVNVTLTLWLFEYGNYFVSLDSGRFVVVHQQSITLSLGGATTKC